MINIKELRIGNIIYELDRNNTNGSKYITEITLAEFYGIAITEHPVEEYYEPIQLTPEILEKCGFVKVDEMSFNLNGVLISVIGNIFVYNWYVIGDMQKKATCFHYLHELQNLFYALTGEELKVNINNLILS